MPLDLCMNKDMYAQNLKEHLLKIRQIHAHASDLPNKPTIGIRLNNQAFKRWDQKVDNLGLQGASLLQCYLERGNVSLNICYYIQENRMIIVQETNDKCRRNQCLIISQKCENNNPNSRKEAKFVWKNKNNGMMTS